MSDEPKVTIVVHPSDKDRIQTIIDFLSAVTNSAKPEIITSNVPPPGTIYLFHTPWVEISLDDSVGKLYPYQKDAMDWALSPAGRMYDAWVQSRMETLNTSRLIDPGV